MCPIMLSKLNFPLFKKWNLMALQRVAFSAQRTPNLAPKIEHLPDQSHITVSGANAAEFLQGLITNDMHHLTGEDSDSFVDTSRPKNSMYTMFLNVKGRIVMDSLIFKSGCDKDHFILECDQRSASSMKNYLKIYKVRRKVDVDISNDLQTYVIFDPESPDTLEETLVTERIGSSFIISEDPRVKQLGYRAISKKNLGINSDGKYQMWRYRLGVSQGYWEIPPGICFPLEYNCDYMHGVSFHKGCYIGQELTARVQHTGVVRKRIMPVKFEKELSGLQVENFDSKDAPGFYNEKNKKIGTLRGFKDQHGIGLMRLEETENAELITLRSNELEVCAKVERPSWWAKEAPKRKQSK